MKKNPKNWELLCELDWSYVWVMLWVHEKLVFQNCGWQYEAACGEKKCQAMNMNMVMKHMMMTVMNIQRPARHVDMSWLMRKCKLENVTIIGKVESYISRIKKQ